MNARVRTTPQADVQALRIDEWWRERRPAAPDLFASELAGAFDLLGSAPDIGRRYPNPEVPGVRRLLLPRSRHHVYYVHEAGHGEVVVLAVWGAVRGSGPQLGRR